MLSVEKWKWSDQDWVETNISLWGMKRMEDNSLRERIRRAWAALRGKLWYDEVCLNEEDVKRLIEVLQAPLKEESK